MSIKQKNSIFLLFAFVFIPLFSFAGSPPVIKFVNGKLVDNLPFGESFIIEGENSFAGEKLSQVKVEVFDTGKNVRRRDRGEQLKQEDVQQAIDARNIVASGVWDSDLDSDLSKFEIHVLANLRFNRHYAVQFTLYKKMKLEDSDKQIIVDYILGSLTDEAIESGESAISYTQIRAKIDEILSNKEKNYIKGVEGRRSIADYYQFSDSTHFNFKIRDEDFLACFDAVGFAYNTKRQLLQDKQNLEIVIEDNDKESIELFQTQIKSKQAIFKEQVEIIKNCEFFPKEVMKQAYKSELSFTSTGFQSAEALQNSKFSYSAGGGMLGLDVSSQNLRGAEYDPLAYNMVRYYFLPRHKGLANPYMIGRPVLNRMSAVFGTALSGKYNYRGQEMRNAIGVNPILGIGIDLNPFITIDVGSTIFYQDPISPLQSNSKLRMGLVLGVNMETDVFNRVSSIYKKQNYKKGE